MLVACWSRKIRQADVQRGQKGRESVLICLILNTSPRVQTFSADTLRRGRLDDNPPTVAVFCGGCTLIRKADENICIEWLLNLIIFFQRKAQCRHTFVKKCQAASTLLGQTDMLQDKVL